MTFDLDAGDCYAKPEIMQDNAELKAKADAINQKLSANLTMDFAVDRIIFFCKTGHIFFHFFFIFLQ